MGDEKKRQDTDKSHFEDTVGMTGPVIITEQINEQKDPELQTTEDDDDLSVISVQKDPPQPVGVGSKKQKS